MVAVGNWVLESTSTVGTGIITLDGPAVGFASFASAIPEGDVWYSIEDSNGNREVGIGSFDGDAILIRTTVKCTLVGTAYNDVNPTAISLSGNATVACTFSVDAYEELLAHISNTSNPHQVSTDDLVYNPAGDPITNSTSVQGALIAHGIAIQETIDDLVDTTTVLQSQIDDLIVDNGFEIIEEYFVYGDFVTSGSDTVITTATTALVATLNNLDIYVSGVIQRFGTDFTITAPSTITLLNKILGANDYVLMKLAVPVTPDLDLRGNLAASEGSNLVGFVSSGTGAITRTVQERLRDFVLITDYGADISGAESSSNALVDAMAALGVTGGDVICPPGTYLFDTTLPDVFVDNSRIVGFGDSTIFQFVAGNQFGATSKNNVGIKDVHFKTENTYLYFDDCDGVTIEGCKGTGLMSSSALSQYFCYILGCDNVTVNSPNLDNFNSGIFLGKSGSTPCGLVRVTGGLIQQTASNHGTGSYNNPTGVYAFEVEDCRVTGTTFKNIKPSSSALNPIAGYGVYEGDGTLGNLKNCVVENCTFINDDGFTTTRPMVGVLSGISETCTIHNNDFIGSFIGVQYGSRNQIISNNRFKGAFCFLASTASIASILNKLVVKDNEFIDVENNQPLILGNGGSRWPLGIVDGNTFSNCLYGAMWLNLLNYAVVINNTIIDCNTSGDTNDFFRAGINFYGCTNGFVDGNTVMNVVTGKANYGVSSSTASHSIVVTENNRFIGMTLGNFLRGFTTTPTTGTYSVGQRLKFWDAGAGGAPGTQCVQKGTQGTLNSGSTTGSISSGSATLTVNAATGLEVGQWISIVGVTGPLRITGVSGTTITLASNADATVSGAAVSFYNAVFKTEAVLAA